MTWKIRLLCVSFVVFWSVIQLVAKMPHSIKAETPVVMQLTLVELSKRW